MIVVGCVEAFLLIIVTDGTASGEKVQCVSGDNDEFSLLGLNCYLFQT